LFFEMLKHKTDCLCELIKLNILLKIEEA
jgi:hypothetical protein